MVTVSSASVMGFSYLACFLLVVHVVNCKENPKEELLADSNDWWKHTIVYQIYPRSFQDSNGDGVGDIKGILSRLDHFEYLHVDAVWLSPVYKSPMADHGYDVSDHKDIDPIFGTLGDMDELIKELHNRGMAVIMDYIPNHTSDQHPWFQASRKGGADNSYSNFYVWHEGKTLQNDTRAPPNNWLSVFGGSAWQWDELRRAYYLHQFAIEQPDLNYRNPAVRIAMEEVFRFWLDRGVDGFRIDAIQTLFETENLLQDEPYSNLDNVLPTDYNSLEHTLTIHQPEIHDVTRQWRKVFDEYEKKTGKHTFVVMEVYDEDLSEAMEYYDSGADMPFNFRLIQKMHPDCGGQCVYNIVKEWMDKMPTGKWPNFVTGNHDQLRITTRKGADYADVMNMLLLTLPGTPTTYQGEEIGQLDSHVTWEQTQDPWGKNFGEEYYKLHSRDPCRGPVLWNGERNAGFSSAETTWLPVHSDYKDHNILLQTQDPTWKASVQIYRQVARLRQEPAFQNAAITYNVVNPSVFSYVRQAAGYPAYLIALNLGDTTSTDDHVKNLGGQFSSKAKVVISTVGTNGEEYSVGSFINLKSVQLMPGEGIICRLENIANKKEEL